MHHVYCACCYSCCIADRDLRLAFLAQKFLVIMLNSRDFAFVNAELSASRNRM